MHYNATGGMNKRKEGIIMKIETSRRGFLRGLGSVSAFAIGGNCFAVRSLAGGQKIKLAAVGLWNKGLVDWTSVMKTGKAELVAVCDCDRNALTLAAGSKLARQAGVNLSKVPFYSDYRKLLDDAGRLGVEAMTVSTTDHTHAPIAIRAMKQGISCYVQKPLVRTLWELDYFRRTAKEHGVITQMGNQGSSLSGFRRGVEILQSGLIGEVRTVHVWTNRPVWPQGRKAGAATQGAADAIPADLNWDAWLATARERPYKGQYGKDVVMPRSRFKGVYHTFNWRGFFDFGCGAYGDMACHTMNLPFRGLELGAVTGAERLFIEDADSLGIAFPQKTTVRMSYAARQSQTRPGVTLPPVDLYWYDGAQRPSADLMPQVVAAVGHVPQSGCLIIGSKGVLCSLTDCNEQSLIAMKGEKKVVPVEQHPACAGVASTIPRRGGETGGTESGPGFKSISADGHYDEFLDAIRGEGPVFASTHSRCYSDVEYSIPQMEGILVGVAAQRIGGKLAWNSSRQSFDSADANALVRPYVRKGWEF